MKSRKLNRFNKLNKKAVFQDWLPLVVGMFVLILIFFFMFFDHVMHDAQVDNAAIEKTSEFSMDSLLLNHLTSPAIVDNKKGNIADLIVWSINNDDYGKLKEETEKRFAEKDLYWSLSIYNADNFRYEPGKRRSITAPYRKIHSFSNHRLIPEEYIKQVIDSGLLLPAAGHADIGLIYVQMRFITKN